MPFRGELQENKSDQRKKRFWAVILHTSSSEIPLCMSSRVRAIYLLAFVSVLPDPPAFLPPSHPHYHNCVQNMRGRGSDHVILFTPCLALFTNDMPLTAKQTGARRHLLIRAVGAYQRRMAGNGYPVTNQISGRTKSGPHLPGLH